MIPGAQPPATIGHTRHAARMRAETGAGTVLLEPEARGTAAAVAACAAWIATDSPERVAAVLPADHHVADPAAFGAAVARAASIAHDGKIVVLGATPTGPDTAYGYIVGTDGGAVRTFVEKPDRARAEALIAEGALWNCGVFVGRADVILNEMRRWAPEIAAAAEAAVWGGHETLEGFLLGAAFAEAPSLPFDRAVMERTDRGAVVALDCGWSDVGAWDAVLAVSDRDAAGVARVGDVDVADGRNVLARAAPGVSLRVIGVSDVAVVAERDGVLVTALDHAQAVRSAAPAARFGSLSEAARALADWFRVAALPLWGTIGFDAARGDFLEALTGDGRPHDPRRRLRVQARQAYVFARATADGLPGPWLDLGRRGLTSYLAAAERPDGLFKTALSPQGEDLDAEARLYEHAFVLLGLAALTRAEPGEARWRAEAGRLREALAGLAHAGGFREAGDTPFQADPQMHLLEAALAWRELDGGGDWSALADQVAGLAVNRLIDSATGAVRELFDADWAPLIGPEGRIEPGHQFEWAWLLGRWGGAPPEAMRRLFAAGERGVGPSGIVVDALWDDLSMRAGSARLWPQTERLRAALALGELDAALSAANVIWRFLDMPVRGLWRERMDAGAAFVDGPAPASSLYHLHGAIDALVRATGEAW